MYIFTCISENLLSFSSKTCLKFWMSWPTKKNSCQVALIASAGHLQAACLMVIIRMKLFRAIIYFVVLPTSLTLWPSWFAWRWTYPRDLNSVTSVHRNLLKRWKQSLNLQTRSRGHDSFPWWYLCRADRSWHIGIWMWSKMTCFRIDASCFHTKRLPKYYNLRPNSFKDQLSL